jgi:signal transduction histidine kinase/ligand-binding sensor domain-containing protein/CheY-like chemotaxis protein
MPMIRGQSIFARLIHVCGRLSVLAFLMLVLLLPTAAQASKAFYKFKNIAIAQGLSNPYVTKVLQDNQGFIWVATQNGLFRFDGYDFKTFRHNPADPSSLADNFILNLFEDSEGILWVSTWHGGFARYHPKTQTFTNYRFDAKNPNSLSSDEVMAIDEGQNGILWIATLGGGLNRFDKNTNTFSHYRHDEKDPTSLSDDNLYTVLEDSQAVLWVGTRNGGLNRFDEKTGQFKQFTHDPADPNSISHYKVFNLFEDADNTLWIGTRGGGINRFDRTNETFISYRHDRTDPHSIGSDQIRTIFQDNDGGLWIGADNGGLNYFNKAKQRFEHYVKDPQDSSSVAHNSVYSIIQGHGGLIWLGTNGGGISNFNPASKRFGFTKHNPDDPSSLGKGALKAIFEDSAGVLWIGTENGLNRYDKKADVFNHYQHDPENPQSLSDSFVKAIFEDSNKRLWIGTENGGLNLMDQHSNTFSHYRHDVNQPDSISDGSIEVIRQDNAGALWLGTTNGLNRFDLQLENVTRYIHDANDETTISHSRVTALHTAKDGSLWVGTNAGLNQFNVQKQSFTRYKHNPAQPNSLSNNVVKSIYQHPNGLFYIATNGGLNEWDPKQNTFVHYRESEGLFNDKINAVMGDKKGNIWLGGYGISLFDTTTKTFSNNIGRGAGCVGANQGAYFQANDGKLFLGIKSYCGFYPDQVINKSQPPKVVFTDFRLLNKSVPISAKDALTPLSKVINFTESLILSYTDLVLSFEFATLHYIDSEANQYKYKLEGFNEDWIETASDNRRATFTNLPAGPYTFRVKASNHEGVWDEQGRSINLIVQPAPWRTWWAYTGYILLISLIVGVIAHQRYLKREALILAKNHAELAKSSAILARKNAESAKQNAESARQNAELAQQNAEKASQAKSIFVADVSHEIRTPLNAILGYTQMLDRDPNLGREQKKKITIIEKSGDHLLGLINNILDLSKIEANAMSILPEDFELVELVKGIGTMLEVRCEEKGIEWSLANHCEATVTVNGDQGKLRQVLINLLGNGIKFCNKGTVTLTLSNVSSGHYLFEVSDTGAGIDPKDQAKIFKAFGQTTEGTKEGGTGLGLAIAFKQVALMGGELQLKSELGKGSCFYFTLPLQPALAPIESRKDGNIEDLKLADGVHVTALVVDDIDDNAKLLIQMLEGVGLKISRAHNGQDALKVLHQQDKLPDLVFMDIRMPVMNGVAALKQMQDDFKDRCPTCIAVTAHAMQQDVAHYLDQGFDHYIAKPFRFEAIYECLDKLLNVEFNYLQKPVDELDRQDIDVDFTSLKIPSALLKSLTEAATDYEISKLEVYLAQLDAIDEKCQHFAKYLDQYITTYDMDGLLEELEKLSSET